MIKEIETSDELSECLTLISEVFEEFQASEYSEVGTKNFYRLINKDSILNLMKQNRIILYGYYENKKVIGVIAINKPDHICLLFVDKDYHKQGVARKLYSHWLKNNPTNIEIITVNSSSYAAGFYQRLGFSFVDGNEELVKKDGIRYHPMILQATTK